MSSGRPVLRYAPAIDGLRAVAVLAVILYHIDSTLMPGGFAGVDVFFVISGFVVSGSLLSLASRQGGASGGWRDGLEFTARRVVRILPGLLPCLLVTLFAVMVFIPASWLSNAIESSALHALTATSNWVLMRVGDDYFAPRAGFNPFTHTWSLAVEEQFYLIFPWLFLSVRSRPGRRVLLFAAASLVSLALGAHWQGVAPGRAYYALSTRFFELAAGVLLLCIVARDGLPPGRAWRVAASWAGLGAILASFVVARPGATPFPDALLPVLGTVLLLAALHGQEEMGAARLLGAPFPQALGRRSYALYLWHWPVDTLLRWTIGLSGPVGVGSALAMTAVLSALSFRFLESPVRVWRARRGLSATATIGLGLAGIGLAYGLASGLITARPLLALSTVMRHREDWYGDTAQDRVGPCSVRTIRAALEGGVALRLGRVGCPANPPIGRLFVLGDSHAGAYLPLFRRWVLETGGEARVLTLGGCGVFGLAGAAPPGCAAFLQEATRRLAQDLTAHDVLFLPALRVPRIADEFVLAGLNAARAYLADPATTVLRSREEAETHARLAAWAPSGARVVFEAPTPVMPSPLFRCADWFDRSNTICAGGDAMDRVTIESWRMPVLDAMARLGRRHPGLSVWDPLPLLCGPLLCRGYRDGKPLYFDGDHLSGFANRLLYSSFVATVAPA